MKERFVNLEGLSGVGKSTVAELLAQQLDAKIVRTIPSKFRSLRKFLDQSNFIDARFCFYLSAVLYSSEEIKKTLEGGRGVVTESYLYRTIAFHRGMGSNLSLRLPSDILLPDYTFHLTCEENERHRRSSSRIKARAYWDFLAESNLLRILDEYAQFQMEVVDTTNLQPNGIAIRIRDFIELKQK